jgi:hypothetical protein
MRNLETYTIVLFLLEVRNNYHFKNSKGPLALPIQDFFKNNFFFTTFESGLQVDPPLHSVN